MNLIELAHALRQLRLGGMAAGYGLEIAGYIAPDK